MTDHLVTLWQQASEIWRSGGWAMWAIAVIALLMFGLGTSVHLKLRAKNHGAVPEATWRLWLEHPEARRGPIGRMMDFATGGDSLEDTELAFKRLHATEPAPFERDLRVMKICVSAAPLVGLLGTVTGMLATFDALASGSGGEKTMNLVARGISEALVTTETGLVVALPGVFFQHQLARAHERFKTFLTHLETVCTQAQYRRLSEARARRRRRSTQLAARSQIVAALRRAVS